MLVVSDTSPISGLLAIDKVVLLKQLYEIVIIPLGVKEELYTAVLTAVNENL
ncbi:MAG TPA: hypothetical protein PLX69_24775 [Leptospiraceae bacterium]|nr:hypothetical protein [Leptospiraceae bacterium]